MFSTSARRCALSGAGLEDRLPPCYLDGILDWDRMHPPRHLIEHVLKQFEIQFDCVDYVRLIQLA